MKFIICNLLLASLYLMPSFGQKRDDQKQTASLVATTTKFEFHSGFWMNLHTFLYQQAEQRSLKPDSGATSSSEEVACKAHLTPEEQNKWAGAVSYYQSNLIRHDLFSGEIMGPIKFRIAIAENALNLQGVELQPEFIATLERAAPIYRKCWWPEHDRANHDWIQALLPLVEQFDDTLAEQFAFIYREPWPQNLIRLDVITYKEWLGGHTNFFYRYGSPISHTVITSKKASYQGLAAFEMLFHEASHRMVLPQSGAIGEQIAQACKAQNKPIPEKLWHAIIFYTAGKVVQRLLAEKGLGDYTPFAYQNKVFTEYLPMLERHWQPYLDGETDFQTAVSNVIKAL